MEDEVCVSRPGALDLRQGPRIRIPIIAVNQVAADAAAAKLFGKDPKSIAHIAMAAEQGLGEIDISKLRTKTIAM